MFYKYKYSSICNTSTKGFDSVMQEQIQVDGPLHDESEADNIGKNICIMMSSFCFLVCFPFLVSLNKLLLGPLLRLIVIGVVVK
jgi:hypothetical protein